MLKIHTDFSGASLGSYTVDGTRVFARLREESLVHVDGFCYDYNCHFAFGVENLSVTSTHVDLLINCADADLLPPCKPMLFASQSPLSEFHAIDFDSRTDRKRAYFIRLNLQPWQRLYLSNYLFRPYEKLAERFQNLGEQAQAVRTVIGHSLEGRQLVCYWFGKYSQKHESVPAVLITSGLHPPECDTLATEAIMEFLASGEGKKLLEKFDIYIVPIANPDGFVHGYNGCNAAQVNFFWKFDELDDQRCPEACALWGLIDKIRPVVYIDFHGYTFQLEGKYASPYLKPVIFHEGKSVRRLVRILNRDLLALSEGRATRGILTYSPSMLASKITHKYNTITYAKYHIHLKDGVEKNKKLAVDVLKCILNRLLDQGVTSPSFILKHPYGRIQTDYWSLVGRALIQVWGQYIRPKFGGVKRWILRLEEQV